MICLDLEDPEEAAWAAPEWEEWAAPVCTGAAEWADLRRRREEEAAEAAAEAPCL